METTEVVENILTHFGKKGMKWGVRNSRPSGAEKVTVTDKRKKIKTSGGRGHAAHPEAVRVRTIGQIAKKSGVKSLSNQQLEEFNRRLNLEQNTKRLMYQDKSPGKKFVAQVLGQTGKTQAQETSNAGANLVKKAIIGKIK